MDTREKDIEKLKDYKYGFTTDIENIKAPKGLNEDVIKFISNIFNAVDEKVKTVQCKKESKKGCNGKSTKCLTHNLWDELESHINNFFDEKNLEDLVKDNNERQI